MASKVEEAAYLHKSVIQGHHIYKAVWNPVLGEVHCLVLEEGNKHTAPFTVMGAVFRAKTHRQCQFGTFAKIF